MAIQTSCAGCGQTLRVADAHAGKLAHCPGCNMIYRVPVPEGVTPAPKPAPKPEEALPAIPTHPGPLALDDLDLDSPSSTPAAADAGASVGGVWTGEIDSASVTPRPHGVPVPVPVPVPTYHRPGDQVSQRPAAPQYDSMWRMRTPEGQVYGPVPRNELDGWVREGRVASDCQLRENDGNWFFADRMYTHLAGHSTQAANPANATFSNAAIVGRESRRLAPDRGATILALGIMGWIIICPFISLAAWIMGGHDLREMSQGRMVRTNIGMTQVGRVLGMLHVLLAGVFLFFLFFISNM